MKIGIVGNGFVGSSVAFGFSPQTGCDAEIKIYDKDANRQDGRLYDRPICGVYGINTWVYWRTTYDYMEITM